MSDERVLPIVQGDWVAGRDHSRYIQIGRVKQAYWDRLGGRGDGAVCMNVVLYDYAGKVLGRVSPAMGGPKTYEPAIEFDETWQRIEKPNFPLRPKLQGIPSDKPGMVTLVDTLFHDEEGAMKPKAIRTKVRKQSSDYRRGGRVIFVERDPNNGVHVEVASLRRAAQEMIDTARLVERTDGRTSHVLRNRAAELNAEADAIMPRVT
jgi:hypothetical protein